ENQRPGAVAAINRSNRQAEAGIQRNWYRPMNERAPNFSPGPFRGRDIFPAAWQVWERFDKAIQFTRTFLALARGVRVWEETPEKLTELKLLSAWQFNLFQSLFSASAATAVVGFVNAVFAPKGWSYSVIDSLVNGSLAPFGLAANAYFAGYAAARDPNNRDELNLSIRAFLYLDGEVGLFTQTFGSIIVAFLLVIPEGQGQRSFLLIPGLIFVFVQIYATQIAIPRRLFFISGRNKFDVSWQQWFYFQALTLVTATCAIQVLF